jgi:hypothetical protein
MVKCIVAKDMKQSKGHLTFKDGYEYFLFERDVFVVPVSAELYDRSCLSGTRIGARFYCTYTSWMQSPIMRYTDEVTA